jgi:hypothetical protein
MPRGIPEAPLEDRFMRRVNTAGPSVSEELGPCWIWTGTSQSQGYGILRRHVWGELLTHRWIYKHTYGELPPDLMVRHKCDVKACVNPAHLEIGTSQDNVGDMIARHPHACGRKLSDAQIAEILEMRATGAFYHDIATIYNVNRRTIEKICLGRKAYL